MPPKKTVTPAKPAAKGTSKTSTGPKAGTSKGTTCAKSKGAAGGAKKEPAKEEQKPVIKKLIEPTEIGLKEIAGIYNYAGDVGLKLKESKRFGKPVVVDITDTDNEKIMDVLKERMDEVYKGFYDDVLDRSILDEEKYMKLPRDSDIDEYRERYSYMLDTFQMIVLTNTDPPSTIMGEFFPVNVR